MHDPASQGVSQQVLTQTPLLQLVPEEQCTPAHGLATQAPWTQVSFDAQDTPAQGSGRMQESEQLPPGQTPEHSEKGTHAPFPGLQRNPASHTTWAHRFPKHPEMHAPWMQVSSGPQVTPEQGSTLGMQDATHVPASQKSNGQGSGWQYPPRQTAG